LDSRGNPYGPTRLKEIIKECFMISKNCSTSYVDILKMTPTEKKYLCEFIIEDAKKAQEMIEENRDRLRNNQ